jgi:hypothetical protein
VRPQPHSFTRTPPKSSVLSRSNVSRCAKTLDVFQQSASSGERLLNSATIEPHSSMSCCCATARMIFALGGNAASLVVCSDENVLTI